MKPIKATPVRIRFRENGYELIVKIVDGPVSMIDRLVKVTFTGRQMQQISDWEPTELLASLDLEGGTA